MKETTLKHYLDGEVSPLSVRSALDDIKGKPTLSAYSNFVIDLEECHAVGIQDLIKLCDDFLDDTFDETDIKVIAFLMIASDHFCWNSNTFPGRVISDVLHDWYVAETNHPVTRENTAIIKDGLLFNKYDPQLLKVNSRRFAG